MEIKILSPSTPSQGYVFLSFMCLIILSVMSRPPLAWGQDTAGSKALQSWFDTAREADRYTSVREGLFDVFDQADDSDIPPSILFSKLKEGAVKNVPPPRLLDGLEQEADRLRTARDIIRTSGFPYPDDAENRERYLRILGINLREGMPQQLLVDQLAEAKARGLELGNGVDALEALLQVRKITDLTQEELLDLGKALYSSSIPSSQYNAISSIFLRARINRLSEREVLGIAVRVFENGDGLIRLEREIDRRKRRR